MRNAFFLFVLRSQLLGLFELVAWLMPFVLRILPCLVELVAIFLHLFLARRFEPLALMSRLVRAMLLIVLRAKILRVLDRLIGIAVVLRTYAHHNQQ